MIQTLFIGKLSGVRCSLYMCQIMIARNASVASQLCATAAAERPISGIRLPQKIGYHWMKPVTTINGTPQYSAR